MKALALTPAVEKRPSRVSKLLKRGIIFATSRKFTTFVSVIGGAVFVAGFTFSDDLLYGAGAITFLAAFALESVRPSMRILRTKP